MATVTYRDTHVAAWMFAGRTDLLPPGVHRLLENREILISPIVGLELQYLLETGRTSEPATVVLQALTQEAGLSGCATSLSLTWSKWHNASPGPATRSTASSSDRQLFERRPSSQRMRRFAAITGGRSGRGEGRVAKDRWRGARPRRMRSTSGFEVDFVIGDHTAVGVKAKESVSPQDLKSLRALAEEKKLKRYLCVCLEPRTRKTEGIVILPFKKFLEALWNGEYR